MTAKAGHGRTQRRHRPLPEQLAARGQLQHAPAFKHGHPVIAVCIDCRTVWSPAITAIARQARLPLRRLARPAGKNARSAQGVGLSVPVPGADGVAGGVCPVERARIGRPGQAVAGGGFAGLALQQRSRSAAVQRPELRRIGVAWLENCAAPKTPQRVGLAVVKAHGRRVVRRGNNLRKFPAPHGRPVNAAAQRHHQPAASCRRYATGLFGHGPAFNLFLGLIHAHQEAARNINPVKTRLLRVPERGFTELIRCRCYGLPSHAGTVAAKKTARRFAPAG